MVVEPVVVVVTEPALVVVVVAGDAGGAATAVGVGAAEVDGRPEQATATNRQRPGDRRRTSRFRREATGALLSPPPTRSRRSRRRYSRYEIGTVQRAKPFARR